VAEDLSVTTALEEPRVRGTGIMVKSTYR
jgi:hypothetical protein